MYVITVQPTLSFWDCGEFLACAFTLSTPHPPGAPLHILVGKIFTMLPLASDVGLRMNYLSVLSSAFSVLFLYLVSVKVIRNWRGNPNSLYDILIIAIPSAIGALSLAFADSFWFNAMEAEVYGFGTFLMALCVYVMMIWWERADEPGSDKYILFFAYVIGLSLGIHLLVVQTVFLDGIGFYFKRFEYSLKSFLIASGVSMFAFFIVYPLLVKKDACINTSISFCRIYNNSFRINSWNSLFCSETIKGFKSGFYFFVFNSFRIYNLRFSFTKICC